MLEAALAIGLTVANLYAVTSSPPTLAREGAAPPTALAAAASAAAAPRQVVVELIERGAGAVPGTSRYEVGLLPDGSPSRLETKEGATRTQLTVRHQLREATQSTVSLDVERERRGEPGRPDTRASFAMQAHITHGKRVLLGKVAKPDGTTFEVCVTLR